MRQFPGGPRTETAGLEQEHLKPLIGIFVLGLRLWHFAGC